MEAIRGGNQHEGNGNGKQEFYVQLQIKMFVQV